MKKTGVIATILVLVSLATVFAFAAGGQPQMVRVFLTFDGAPDHAAVSSAGGHVLHDYTLLDNTLSIEVPETALNGLLNNPHVTSVEFDAEATISAKPDRCTPWPACKDDGGDPEPPAPQVLPWGVDHIDAELSVATGNGATVCIIDTGVDRTHPDLVANIAGGQNFVAKGRSVDASKWADDHGHGTHVAGTVAALDNSEGVVGVAPQASLLIAKALDRRGSGYLSDIIAAMEYCATAGADVISMSLGATSHVQAFEDASSAVAAQGVLIVAAAGNDYGGPVNYPAAYASVMAVGATDISSQLASFSNVGPEVEIAAPGVDILSTTRGGSYGSMSGTSMSTPHVSGVVALAKELNPGFDGDALRLLLQSTADDLGAPGRDSSFGFGLVDAELN
jgi:subtilisin family serine protease